MRDGCRRTLGGCGVAVAIAVVGVLALHWNARQGLRDQASGLRAELRAWEDHAGERPPLAIPEAGNAVMDYQVVEWVLKPRDEWAEDPPAYLANLQVRRARKAEWLTLTEAFVDANKGKQPSKKAVRLARRYRFLIDHVRRGLSRERCEWGYSPRLGPDAEHPNYVAYRAYAGIVSVEARLKPDQASRLLVELAALGRDLGQHDSLIGVLFGSALERGACLQIQDRCEADPRWADVLEGLPGFELERALTSERLLLEVLFAEASGERLLLEPSELAEKLGPLPKPLLLHEWRSSRRTHLSMIHAALLPAGQRKTAVDEVGASAKASWSITARITTPNMGMAADSLDEVAAERTKALAALRGSDL